MRTVATGSRLGVDDPAAVRAERDQQHDRQEAAAGEDVEADIAIVCGCVNIGLDLRRGEAAEIAERDNEGYAASGTDAPR